MPEIVTRDRAAGAVKPGNTLFGVKVIETDPKRVNTTITLENPVDDKTRWTFKLTDVLEVGVEEKTAEERAAAQREMTERAQQDFISVMRKLHSDAVEQVEAAAEKAADRIASGWGVLDSWMLDAQLTAAANFEATLRSKTLWEKFDVGEVHWHPGIECDFSEPTEHGRKCVIPSVPITEYEMVDRIYGDIHAQLIKRALSRRVSSRSTSLTSNLCEDYLDEAYSRILKSLNWHLPSELRSKYQLSNEI